MIDDFLAVLRLLVNVFDALEIPYLLGGSIVSSHYGEARYTQDIDIVAALRLEHIAPLINALEPNFYIDEESIREAIETHTSFNVLYLPAVIKADIMLPAPDPWITQEFLRSRPEALRFNDQEIRVNLPTPEDMILQKLRWYRLGNHVSERQWKDILGMLETRMDSLDRDYMRRWATALLVADLLEEALAEAESKRT